MGDDTSLKRGCRDTSLGAGGADNITPIFPDDTGVELPFWDSVAQEPARLSGVNLRLWSLRRAGNRHPLYAEPVNVNAEWSFQGPWEVMGALEFDQGNAVDHEATAEGIQRIANATLHIARKELESVEAPEPKVGDVIDFWDRAPWGTEFQYWDVKRANPDGNMWTSGRFVQYRLELVHRSRFEPGRKVLGEKV